MKILLQKPLQSILKKDTAKNKRGLKFDLEKNVVEEFRKESKVNWQMS